MTRQIVASTPGSTFRDIASRGSPLGPALGLALLLLPAPPPHAASARFDGRDPSAASSPDRERFWCGAHPGRDQEGLLRHQVNVARLRASGKTAPPRRPNDVGDIAIVEDDGSVITPPNPFDVAAGSRILFRPSGTTGFTVSAASPRKIRLAGEALSGFIGGGPGSPTDDGYVEVRFKHGFRFPFYGQSYDRVFVGTNGFLTFGSGDANSPAVVSTDAFIGAQPRIAAFWADLDPTNARIAVKQGSEKCTITWIGVPLFVGLGRGGGTSANTFQVKLFSDGRIQLAYRALTDGPGLVGVSPGGGLSALAPIDLSQPPPSPVTGAPYESFGDVLLVDRVALVRAFYDTHPDNYDFLYVWTDFPREEHFLAGYFAVQNDVSGIGQTTFDDSASYGSQGRLQGVVDLNTPGLWPENPRVIFIGLNSGMSILAQEQAHRWGAFVRFMDDGAPSTAMLGRDGAHWSFFLNTESTLSVPTYRVSSSLEGNVIVPTTPGTFVTAEQQIAHYSALDQYLMGFRESSEVPDTFLVEGAGADPAWNPDNFVELTGASRTIGLDDIIAAEGPRDPPASTSQRDFRTAWVLLVQEGATPSDETVAKLERYRAAWQDYVTTALEGRAAFSSSLLP